MTLEQFEEFETAVFISQKSCKHSHFGCSTYDGGPCIDEVYSNLPDSIRVEIEGE